MPDTFDAAPKVELHLHLEGAIPLDILWELIQSGGGDIDVPDRTALERRFAFRDCRHFIDTWWWMTGFIRFADDFTAVAEAVARRFVAQNIVYAEASYSPTDFERHGLTPQEIGTAIRRGLGWSPCDTGGTHRRLGSRHRTGAGGGDVVVGTRDIDRSRHSRYHDRRL